MKEFVIVIEADNKRAHAAYLKGLADLDLIWPQLMLHADRVDGQRNAAIEAEDERKRHDLEAYLEALRDHGEAVKRWERSVFRGQRPTPPLRPYGIGMSYASYLGMKDGQRRSYESIRAELKHMADVAGAATGPFRMTEHQVRRMVAWEDGSRVEELMRRIGSGDTVPDEVAA